jgi:glycosyltransferase involved in cell wall biosynthesis
MSEIEPVTAAQRLRIAVLGNFDGVHTRSWLRWFVARGHDIHAISFYQPATPLEGVTMHVLRDRKPRASTPITNHQLPTSGATAGEGARAPGTSWTLPAGVLRLIHAMRYRRAGLRRVLDDIAPDIFHAHFVVEHGFYGALAGVHPYVVTAWGSDILVEPGRDPLSRQVAKWTLRRADLVTSNNRYMADRIAALGAPRSKVEVVTLGADAYFGERWADSVNVAGRNEGDGPVMLSTRAHEALYDIASILDAYAIVVRLRPGARLIVAHSGSLTDQLRAQAATIGGDIEFTGTVGPERLRELMTSAEVFVSVPASDGTSVALLQAMAAGAFPIVSDLESQREWIDDGQNGLRVPLGAPVALVDGIMHALGNPDLRRRAADLNRIIVAERGTNETQMAKMEQLYLRLARHPPLQ